MPHCIQTLISFIRLLCAHTMPLRNQILLNNFRFIIFEEKKFSRSFYFFPFPLLLITYGMARF